MDEPHSTPALLLPWRPMDCHGLSEYQAVEIYKLKLELLEDPHGWASSCGYEKTRTKGKSKSIAHHYGVRLSLSLIPFAFCYDFSEDCVRSCSPKTVRDIWNKR